MVAIYIFAGLLFAVIGITIIYITKKKHKKNISSPPSLPPRTAIRAFTPIASRTQARTSTSSVTRALPPRRSTGVAAANPSVRNANSGYGPRGIKPTQFPCCPFDKQRNVSGEQQLIFWDSGANCYYCSRGHRFKSNGKLL